MLSVMVRRCAMLLLLGLSLSSAALAQDPYEGATADDLFKLGMEAMNAGDFAKACPLLGKSIAVVPAMAAEFRLAECLEKLGKTASAWRHFRNVAQAATQAGKKNRAEKASERALALEPKLTRIRIVVPDEVARLAGLLVERNGERVDASQWNVDLPIDPDEQRVVARAPDHESWSIRIAVKREGEIATFAVPLLRALSGAPHPPADAALSPGAKPPDKQVPAVTIVSGQAIAGMVVGSLGVVMMGIGVGIGLAAKSSYGQSATLCNAANECNVTGVLIREDARRLGNAGTGVFAVGGAALLAGVITLATAPWKKSARATAGWSPGPRLIVSPAGFGAAWAIVGALP